MFRQVLPYKNGFFLQPNTLLHKKSILFKISSSHILNRKLYSSKTPNNELKTSELEKQNNIKALLKEVNTIPNIITISRIISTPLITYSLIHQDYKTSISLFSYAAISDFVDGFIARKFNMTTRLGSILDPFADKILILSTICGLYQVIPTYVFSLFLLKDSLLIFGTLISFAKNKNNNFMTQQKTNLLQMKPTYISKVNTALQLLYIGGLFVFMVYKKENEDEEHGEEKKDKIEKLETFFKYFGIIVSTTTVLSGLSYLGPKSIRSFFK